MKTPYKGFLLDATPYGVDIFRDGCYVGTLINELDGEAGEGVPHWTRKGKDHVDDILDDQDSE